MTDQPQNLAAALAAVQANLPAIVKGETAEVVMKTGGKYNYRYADLADVSAVILPMLGKVGLSWITRPTINDGGKFVLAYELLHVCGESKAGEYPLSGGTAQEIGSAITYARRYALCAVTGVAPAADDDDGALATRQAQRDSFEDARPARPSRDEELAKARAAIGRASTPEQLQAIDRVVTQRIGEGVFTQDDAQALAQVRVERVQFLSEQPAAEQSDLGGDWPEPRKPGSGDPA